MQKALVVVGDVSVLYLPKHPAEMTDEGVVQLGIFGDGALSH